MSSASGARKRICLIGGDGAAAEAVLPSAQLIHALGVEVDLVQPLAGEAALAQHGTGFPQAAKAAVDACDTTLFGATGGPSGPVLSYLRWGKQTYANIRPMKWRRGYVSPLAHPEGMDYVIVRENLEDFLGGKQGDLAAARQLALGPSEGRGGFAVKVITEAGTRRVAEVACRIALQRLARGKPGKVTAGAKHNVLRHTDGLFVEVVRDVVARYPGLSYEQLNIDNLARVVAAAPQELDVVVLPNQYGDILSGVAAGALGGLGLPPSGCYGDRFAYFEPVHGSVPDLAGKGIINPTATILSVVMLLEHLGFPAAAERLERALAEVYEAGSVLTPDQGGRASTLEFCAAVRSRV